MYLQTEKDFQSSQFSESNSDVQILGVLYAGDLSACSQGWGMLSVKTAFIQHGSALNTVSTQQFTLENRGKGVCGRRITKRKYEGWLDRFLWRQVKAARYWVEIVKSIWLHVETGSLWSMSLSKEFLLNFGSSQTCPTTGLPRDEESWRTFVEKETGGVGRLFYGESPLPACVRSWVQNAHNSRTARLASCHLRTQKAETVSLGQSD